ncbi:MAG TPA: Wadjet anti-phage system protein JetD domain-containing protein [Woeseiaceae bacterium]|nr:Wadjet anti-phage system protein JetD domain-containing protein [Woeseiaceae bacterium]
MTRWTSARGIVERVEKRWRSGEILAARVTGDSLFPMEVRLTRPGPRDIAERFGEVMDWSRELVSASREARGRGFTLRHETIQNRVQGANALPVSAVVPTESDALDLIRKRDAAAMFQTLAAETLARHPVLKGWLARYPHRALEHAAEWQQVLAVLDWFVAHPRPGLYLRQLDVPGVDTKFIEARRKLLSELLDVVLPDDAVDRLATGTRNFNRRYGLRTESPLVRFRLLDPALFRQGISDLSLLAEEFAALDSPAARVFITENRVNGLAFPDCPGSMVIFGLGYGLERLSQVPWLRDTDVLYWGDIDTHGFGMLNRVRATLPHARSFLMDRRTLICHRALWTSEPGSGRYVGDTARLTSAEKALYEELLADQLGSCVRLEQERIGFRWLQDALNASSVPTITRAASGDGGL